MNIWQSCSHHLRQMFGCPMIRSSRSLGGAKFLFIDPGVAEDYLEVSDDTRLIQGTVDLTELIRKAIYNSGSGGGAKSD